MAERRYETLILLQPDLGETGARDVLERIKTLLEENGATVGTAHDWGVRDMAYLIEKHKRAHFGLFEFQASPATLAEVERNLQLMEPVLRFLSVRQEADAPPAVELRTAGNAEGRGWGDRREGRGDDRRHRFDDEDERPRGDRPERAAEGAQPNPLEDSAAGGDDKDAPKPEAATEEGA